MTTSTASTEIPRPAKVDKSGDRVKKMFAEIAPRYDLMNHVLSMNVDHYWRWWTVRKIRPNQVDPILDMCCGTGDLAFAFHSYTRGKVAITAADFCPEMLALGEQKRDRRKIAAERIRFVEADAQALPFDDNHFQVVSVAFGLRNVADTDKGLREMLRVLKPGGKLAVLEFSIPTWQPFRGIYLWYFKNILPRIGQLFARNNSSAYNYLPDSVGEFPFGQALADKIVANGFASAEYFPLTGGIATLYVATKPE